MTTTSVSSPVSLMGVSYMARKREHSPAQTTSLSLIGPSLTSLQQKEKGKNRQAPPIAPAQSSLRLTDNKPQPPTVTSRDDDFRVLLCLIEGDSNIFQVKAPSNGDVLDLKKLIHLEKDKGILRDVNASDLILWKVDINLVTQDKDSLSQLTINQDDRVEKLVSWTKTKKYWPIQPADDRLHVFVKPLAAARMHELEDLSAEEPLLKRQRTKYYELFPSDAPSTLAQPSNFHEVQCNTDIQMFCNRPRSVTASPITLLHPIFGGFVDDSETSRPDPKISSFVVELATMMCNFYEDEGKRVQAFRLLIWNHFSIKLEAAEVTGTKFITNGHASVGCHVYLNTEGQNEFGSTPADPSFQSAFYYHHHIRNQATCNLASRFPCLHIYYSGPFLGFAGSVFSDRIHYEPLSPLIPFHFSPHDSDSFAMATRFFCAFRNATSALQDYYANLYKAPVPRSFFPGEARFPYPTRFKHIQTSAEIQFRLVEQPTPRLGFLGMIDGSLPDGNPHFFIKFVRTYALDLHRHCAELHHAPRLLGFEELPGGWKMVVMEFLGDHIPFSNFRKPSSISPQLRQLLVELVESFQKKKFVHGDLRASNILVHDDAAGNVSMKLVDFDWGGVEGVARYPLAINRVSIRRPEGVIDGALITAKHDLQMATDIFFNLP